MVVDYAGIVLTTDHSTRRIAVLCVWGVIAFGWIATFAIRLKLRRQSSKTDED
jgi:hypothetical protein